MWMKLKICTNFCEIFQCKRPFGRP